VELAGRALAVSGMTLVLAGDAFQAVGEAQFLRRGPAVVDLVRDPRRHR